MTNQAATGHNGPSHHLNEEWLMSYAAGSLDEAYSLVVASHLDYCADCRDKLRAAEAVGGVLVQEADPVPVAEGSLARMMALLDAPEDNKTAARSEPRVHARSDFGQSDLPRPLLDYVGGNIEQLRWRSIGPGVKAVRLDAKSRDDSRLWLLRAAPGTPLPNHGHRGSELTLIVRGSYGWGTRAFGPGDVDDVDDDVWHAPHVTDDGECICLVAVDAPLRLQGVFARLFQPLIGI